MKKCVLGEFADLIPGVSYTPDGIASSGIRILRGGNINSSELQLKEDDVILSESYQCKDNEVHEGDTIVVASSGSADAFGKAATSWVDLPGVQIGAFLRIVRPRKREYAALVSAWVTQPIFQRYIGSVAKGTGINNIRKEYIEKYPINVDDSGLEQFSELYESICKKIALNRKRIATLEAMAKEIYDYWFVQFDFPDAHGRPYKSSGGAMVYNPDLKREIPKGWEVKSINDCGEFFRGVAYSHEDEKQCGENVVLVMRGNNIKCGHIVDDSDRAFIDKAIVGQDQLMTKFSVLFAMSSGSKEHVGKTAVYYDYPAMAAYGAFCSKYVPSDSYRYFMFNFLSSSTYRAFVKRICGGTGINNMKEEYFNVPLFALPGDIGQVRKFNELTATIYAQVYNCTQEMSKLMSLRDFLLPLLMNGQVKVA